MAPRKKAPPKPMFALRFDFIESLENLCQQSIMLLQCIETVMTHTKIGPGVKEILQERVKAFRAALMSETDTNEES